MRLMGRYLEREVEPASLGSIVTRVSSHTSGRYSER